MISIRIAEFLSQEMASSATVDIPWEYTADVNK